MINILPVKKLIEFRRLSEKSQATFANKLKIPKPPKKGDGKGGDYWVRSTSALSNAFKDNDNKFVKEKIEVISSEYDSTQKELTKLMYKRNLEILHPFSDFDFSVWHPADDLEFLPKHKIVLTISDLPIQVIPSQIFAYEDKGQKSVGGIWFVVWLNGYNADDLGIYSETLFGYLSLLYSKEYKIDPNYCLIVDTAIQKAVSYQQILDAKVPSALQSTIDSIKKYLG